MGAPPWDPHVGPERDPLLHQLLRAGLVEREPGGPWRLSELAQRRLSELAAPPPPADKVVHFGHHCAGCGELRPTRRRGARYLCAACDTPPAATNEPAASPRRTA